MLCASGTQEMRGGQDWAEEQHEATGSLTVSMLTWKPGGAEPCGGLCVVPWPIMAGWFQVLT